MDVALNKRSVTGHASPGATDLENNTVEPRLSKPHKSKISDNPNKKYCKLTQYNSTQFILYT